MEVKEGALGEGFNSGYPSGKSYRNGASGGTKGEREAAAKAAAVS